MTASAEVPDSDAATWFDLGTAYLRKQKYAEALSAFDAAIGLEPDNARALFNQGICFQELGRSAEAVDSFRKSHMLDPQAATAVELALAHAILKDIETAAAVLKQNGLDAPRLLEGPETLAELVARLTPRVALHLMYVLRDVETGPAMAALGKALMKADDTWVIGQLASGLPVLLTWAHDPDVESVHLELLKKGFGVLDFRPRHDDFTLRRSQNGEEISARILESDKHRYDRAVETAESASVWVPVPSPDGRITLRAAIPGAAELPTFAVRSEKSETARRVLAHASPSATRTLLTATVDLLPGKYTCALMKNAELISREHAFVVPSIDHPPVDTRAADIVGVDGATFTGRVSALTAGARVRFEYGADPTALTFATPWEKVAPPRTASFFQPIYRHRGEWLPMSTKPGWVVPVKEPQEVPLAPLAAAAGRPSLYLGDVFAKDRNQLNGIGSHEMPVGVAWCDTGTDRPHSSLAGGSVDLRDAEVSFVVGGKVQQKGAACHFWIAHQAEDLHSKFYSQWALTGTPFPDASLENGSWSEVTFELPNDPRSWTYTGNNPREQGDRASRYRRRPLSTTLSANNQPHVLIFSFGDERDPPTGYVTLSSATVHYRNHSILSPAYGAELIHWPAGSAHDPLVLTEGSRGFEDRLWLSGPSPHFPAEFRWRLKQPTELTHFQINQHPYYPARAIEVLGEDETGAIQTLWAGELPQGRTTHDEPEFRQVDLGKSCVVASITLRVLSAYNSARWGLDGFEVFGIDAPYTPDGQPCSVSADVLGLTPGGRIFYRIVLEDGGERFEGETLAIDLPSDRAPIIESATPLRRAKNLPCYLLRANAMGGETEVWGELTLPSGQTLIGKKLYLGCQPTSRHAHYFPDHLDERDGTMRLIAKNEFGAAVCDVAWPIG